MRRGRTQKLVLFHVSKEAQGMEAKMQMGEGKLCPFLPGSTEHCIS